MSTEAERAMAAMERIAGDAGAEREELLRDLVSALTCSLLRAAPDFCDSGRVCAETAEQTADAWAAERAKRRGGRDQMPRGPCEAFQQRPPTGQVIFASDRCGRCGFFAGEHSRRESIQAAVSEAAPSPAFVDPPPGYEEQKKRFATFYASPCPHCGSKTPASDCPVCGSLAQGGTP